MKSTLLGLVKRKSSTTTELFSSSGAVRTFRMLPVSPTRAPRCMNNTPATTRPTQAMPIPHATQNWCFMSDFTHDVHDLLHGGVRRGNQGAVEEVGLETDLALIAILVERLHDRPPVFLFRAGRHHTLALHLNVQNA